MDNQKDHSDQPEKSSTQQPQNAVDENVDAGSLPSNVGPVSRAEVPPIPAVTIQTARIVPPSFYTTPPPAAGGGGGVTAGASGSREGSRAKKGRSFDPRASSSGGLFFRFLKPKRRIDARAPPVCAVCRRRFPSYYSLFGHLRSHDKREWGGAFPPPRYNPDWVRRGGDDADQQEPPAANQIVIEQEVIPALLGAAQETLARMNQDAQIAPREFDLNVHPQDEAGPSSAGNAETTGLDLNFPPPKEEEEGNDDDEDAPAA